MCDFCEHIKEEDGFSVQNILGKYILSLGDKCLPIEYCPLCGNELISESEAVIVEVDKILDSVQAEFAKYKYARRFNRTATKKKFLTILHSKDKDRKLFPIEILYAYKMYLWECSDKEIESQFVKMSETFATNSIYDYARRKKIQERVETDMTAKYGAKWRKTKFVYK